ncbi:hypothetical protein BDZ94DRAFT_1304436 [Collybia nuda]|uniref:Uncharacterized protein n=1 Tax=Collybia nuda TaxID=64659 RepID=A0A9P5YJD4_9AGAR|nr:hypothetical protein BDZ94DRAFT_1304436 [Collybia nuda]
MSSDVPTASPRNCFLAQTTPYILGNGPMNPDVGGFAIGVSSIVYNICVSIVVTLLARPKPQPEIQDDSEEMASLSNGHYVNLSTTESIPIPLRKSRISIFSGPLQASIIGLFSLNHAILLSTLTTINLPKAKLTLFEAHFAVAVTASPVTVYLVYKSYAELLMFLSLRYPTEEFTSRFTSKDINVTKTGVNARAITTVARRGVAKFSTCAVVALGVLIPISWMMLNLVVSYSTTAFTNSHYCQNLPLGSWFEYQVLSNFVGVLDVMGKRDLWNDVTSRKGLGIVSLVALWLWGILFVHHLHDISFKLKQRREKYKHWWFIFRWLWDVLMFIKISWTGIARSHPWHFILVICCFHWSWVLGIYKGIKPDPSYEFSFGQALSVFSTILPILALVGVGMSGVTNIKRWSWKAVQSKFKDEIGFFLTREHNPWRPVSGFPPRSVPRRRWITIILIFLVSCLVVIVNGGFIVWVYYYTQAGTKPNIRSSVNNPHKNWKFFSVCLYVYGFVLGSINAEVSFRLSQLKFDQVWPKLARRSYRGCLFVLAFFLCASPLFSPFLALALAQEFQWRNGCSSCAGRANLEGGAQNLKPPQAYIHLGDNVRLDYIITNGSDLNHWTFDLKNTTVEFKDLADFPVIIQSVSYDLDENSISAKCLTPNASTPEHCMWGDYHPHDYFAFFLNDTRTNTQIQLRAEYKEWNYSDDAPSFRLNYAEPNGGRVMETAVTKRNHCESLLICLDSDKPGFETIVPLGLALWAEDAFASYCTTTGLVI